MSGHVHHFICVLIMLVSMVFMIPGTVVNAAFYGKDYTPDTAADYDWYDRGQRGFTQNGKLDICYDAGSWPIRIYMMEGETVQFCYTDRRQADYYLNDEPEIAMIDPGGIIHAVGEGETKILAEWSPDDDILNDDSGSGTFEICVRKTPQIEWVKNPIKHPIITETADGVYPVLPETAQAYWTDGRITNEKVTWDPLSPEDYSGLNTVTTVHGRMNGYDGDIVTKFAVTSFQTDGEQSARAQQSESQPAETAQDAAVTMYRAYNPNSGEHFYTGNTKEFSYLISIGWRNEGTGWVAPQSSSTPVYRLYNKNGGEHHYTMSAKEKNALVKAGWKDEGIGWYSDDQKRTPLYRQYNPNAFANNHNYTTSEKEKNYLVSIGWRDEGLAWYGVRAE